MCYTNQNKPCRHKWYCRGVGHEGKAPALQLTLALTNSNDFQHLKHTGLVQLQNNRAYSSLTLTKTLHFFKLKGCLFS